MNVREGERNVTGTEAAYSITCNSTDIDDHIHCTYCFCVNCQYNRCALRPCPECHVMLHGCKLEDHLLICAKVTVVLFQILSNQSDNKSALLGSNKSSDDRFE